MKRTIFIFSGLTVVLSLLFQLNKFSLMSHQLNGEFIIVIAGISFIAVGYLLSRLFEKADNIEVAAFSPDSKQFLESGLSNREYEILQLMAEGHSNIEIGQSLFISESTVKGHVSKILTKLDARRRTQAIQIARELNLLAH